MGEGFSQDRFISRQEMGKKRIPIYLDEHTPWIRMYTISDLKSIPLPKCAISYVPAYVSFSPQDGLQDARGTLQQIMQPGHRNLGRIVQYVAVDTRSAVDVCLDKALGWNPPDSLVYISNEIGSNIYKSYPLSKLESVGLPSCAVNYRPIVAGSNGVIKPNPRPDHYSEPREERRFYYNLTFGQIIQRRKLSAVDRKNLHTAFVLADSDVVKCLDAALNR